jgi:hypothetical protein
MSADFSIERFEAFCRKLMVDTKERGRVPLTWLGTQRYFVQEVSAGLKADVHTFVVLKGRQLGISTVSLALDLYWLFKHSGLQGLLVTDTDENREIFRSYLTQYIDSLPASAKPRGGGAHNRTQLTLTNASRLVYLVAGTRKQGNLGRGKAGNFMHATECSSWGDEEGYASLMNTLAQKNPDRLYIFESTARGYNMFYETWETAKKSKTQRAIFIGWWRNEIYRKERNTTDFKTYWDGTPTSDERVWIRDVFDRYRYNIQPEQLAWWRWYVAEQMKGDEMMALQEMPPTEDYAFQLSGSKFFSGERVNLAFQAAMRNPEPGFYRYKFGLHYEDTEFVETSEENAEVQIWEMPQEGGVYVIGADPAYGSSEWADEFAVCVLRCYADRVEQVAEVGTPDWNEAQYAWAIAHLAGSYKGAMLCLEMQGPGGAVFNELQNLKRAAASMPPGDPRLGLYNVVGGMRDYLWKKQDALYGSFAYQWQTNAKEKIRMMTTLRNYFEREMVMLNSMVCIQQFRNIRRDGDQVGGEGRAKDDRVIALAIAVVAWNDWIMQEMMVDNRTYALEHRPPEESKQVTTVERAVLKYLTHQGIEFNPRQ